LIFEFFDDVSPLVLVCYISCTNVLYGRSGAL
jgi:hypothetical protein